MTVLILLLQQDAQVRKTIKGPPWTQWLDRFMKWAFQDVPQTVQKLGVPLAFLVAAGVIALLIWKRHALVAWWRSRSAVFQGGVLAVVLVGGIAAVGSGAYVWHYMQHDNDFCNSCHVMEEPFKRFQTSEHSQLSCHDCHQQSIWASLRQVQLWVANRPEDVGPHAPVPSDVCARCHNVDNPDSTWQRISQTAGHRVHLEADTSALANIQCVTCHGAELHRFVPADQTCGQSGCHESSKTEIVLGKMAGQTDFHCTICHDFTTPVPEKAPLDTVRAALVPRLEDCDSCHEMKKVLVGLDPSVDPHDAVCGTCHNPHTQEAPEAAKERCAECHSPAASLTPFHRGLPPGVLEDCIGCHMPHTFKVEGKNCIACHADIIGGTPTMGPKAHGAEHTEGPVLPPSQPPVSLAMVADVPGAVNRPGVAQASLGRTSSSSWPIIALVLQQQQQRQRFNHLDHRDVECTDCHSSRETHGQVTLESRSQCLQCHHSTRVVTTRRGCAGCHGRSELGTARAVEIMMRIVGRTRTREVAFAHDKHASLSCATCHGGGVSMRVERTCASCHENHHTASADCTSCHRDNAREVHTRNVHIGGCAGSGCHEQASYGSMTQGRNTCLACHTNMRDHRPGKACAACHKVTFASATHRSERNGRR